MTGARAQGGHAQAGLQVDDAYRADSTLARPAVPAVAANGRLAELTVGSTELVQLLVVIEAVPLSLPAESRSVELPLQDGWSSPTSKFLCKLLGELRATRCPPESERIERASALLDAPERL